MEKKLHVVMFPWFAMGHMTPFLHLANKLAERGHKTTLLLPNKSKLHLELLNLHPSLITLHPITVPHVDPLPQGTETASDIAIHLTNHLATALDLTQPEVKAIVATLLPVDLMFYDMAHWIPEVASLFNIKTVCYKVVCAASLAIAVVPARNLARDRPITEEDVAQPPPGYPSKDVVLHGPEARSLLFIGLEFGSGLTFYERVSMSVASSDAIAIRTCREIEGSFCDYMGSQYNKPVFLTGPILPESGPARGSLDAPWAEWLGQYAPGEVIFCAFGSQFILEQDQFQEIVLGFEMTNLPFLVAVKPPTGCASIEEALPEGFKERVGDRGVITGGWVQQPLILAHPSVGCFVNHCGFGSMWESLTAKSQIVLVPQLGDQILNTRLMAGELKVAVEVEKTENGWVSKESLCKAIMSVMDEKSEIGCLVKNNHAKWRDMISSQGFMSGYIDNFVKDLLNLVA
ncbi:anthocyanidin 3-O-glucoside 2'''-O-xylosyltransferase-like [Silene latifolia]|uniref:anthocyanidin 3-O-glucoside 2'''-O-xylosyltransferase-like n=1 Tax=Silene latifolia TaxID=37657 RepID=UPI003D76A94F